MMPLESFCRSAFQLFVPQPRWDLSQATPSSACVPNPASPRAKPGEADAMPGIANMFNDLSVS
jgi:hypothetical protein